MKNLPTPAYDDKELRRANDDKEQTLEVIAEIPEDINTILENCQQDAEESSPVQLVTEGKRLITSISQTLDKIAKVPIQENSPPPQPNAGLQVNSQDNKQSDANGTRQVATYFANSTVPNEILAARPSVNSFEGTPLSTPFEQSKERGWTSNNCRSNHSCWTESSLPMDLKRERNWGGKEGSLTSSLHIDNVQYRLHQFLFRTLVCLIQRIGRLKHFGWLRCHLAALLQSTHS